MSKYNSSFPDINSGGGQIAVGDVIPHIATTAPGCKRSAVKAAEQHYESAAKLMPAITTFTQAVTEATPDMQKRQNPKLVSTSVRKNNESKATPYSVFPLPTQLQSRSSNQSKRADWSQAAKGRDTTSTLMSQVTSYATQVSRRNNNTSSNR